jgi:hypothetical protein
MNSRLKFALPLLLLTAAPALAWQAKTQKLSKEDQDALKQTQDLLKDQKQREQAAKDNSEAQKALDRAKELGGTQENTDQIFSISSDIMESIVSETEGDPEKMQLLLLEAQKNPEKFYNNLSAEQKARIRSVSGKIEKNKSSAP